MRREEAMPPALLPSPPARGELRARHARRKTPRQRERHAELSLQRELARKAAELARAEARLERAEAKIEKLSRRILDEQDRERRRLARDLHDTTGQKLAALAMSLSIVKRHSGHLGEGARNALAESVRLAEDSVRDIRTFSFLLHPPLLDKAGLDTALRSYVDGFSKRSGIGVDLDLPRDLGTLSRLTKTTLFRIVQESLTNVLRHSESLTARVSVSHRDRHVTLEVRDEGHGVPQEMAEGSTSKDVAVTLGISVRTAETHRAHLMRKLDAHSVSDLVRYAVRNGVIQA